MKPFTYYELINLIADLKAENDPINKDIINFYERLRDRTENEILKKILIELKLETI
jgi:site-specific DNA-adenine methylase